MDRAALIIASTAIIVMIGVGCFAIVQIIAWVGRPFPGFIPNQRLAVAMIGQYHWTGMEAGLRWPDKIIKANDLPVKTRFELQEIVNAVPAGTPVTYSVQRGQEEILIVVPTMVFSWSDLAIVFGPVFLTGLIYLALGLIVFIMKPNTMVVWIFLCTCCLLAFYNLSGAMAIYSGPALKLYLVAAALFPAACIHLAAYFPEQRHIVMKSPKSVLVPYFLSFCIAAGFYITYPGASFFKLWNVFLVYLITGTLAIIYSVILTKWKSDSPVARQRAKVILFGSILAFPVPTIGFLSQSVFGSFLGMRVLNNFSGVFALIFPASVAYAIAKHNLFDVDVYIKRTTGYVIMTGIVMGGYFVFQTGVKTAILDPLFGQASEQVYPLLFALLTVFAFNPISRKVQSGVDKLFFRKAYDYKATVARVSEAMTSMSDIRAFIASVLQTVTHDIFVDRVGVIMLDARRNKCEAIFSAEVRGASTNMKDPCLTPDDPLLSLLSAERKLITKYDIAEDPHYELVRGPCARRFEELSASLALPLFYHEEFAGIMTLGYKKSGHFYTREDIELLKTLSLMTSTAIEQAREKGQRAVLMQLFSKHVSPEVAESLWNKREQFLDGGRPISQKFTITAMFTDLQGFSTLSEKQDPEAIMSWLNMYMEMVTNTVMKHGGVVDDFFGDGVKINFGVPIPRTTEDEIRQDAVKAVTCALALEREMEALNERMASQGSQPLRMRVGIYTGPAVAGSLGSADRMKYTTLGDTVNTAARLESYGKELSIPHLSGRSCRILIGESTHRYTDKFFEAIAVGDLALKGKETKISVYCVVGQKGD